MFYAKLIWKSNRGLILFGMIFISLFQFLILYLVTTFDTESMLAGIMNQMPGKMKIFLGENFFSTLTYDGAAAFGYNHPIILTIMAMIAISLPVRHISRELEQGTMELLLAYPIKRTRLILKLWQMSGVILAVVVLTAFIGSLLATKIFHEIGFEGIIKLFQISVNIWLLFLLIMSYTMLFAAFGSGGGAAGSTGAMVTLFFYLMLFLGQLLDALKFTLSYNIFNYFQPQDIMFGRGTMLRDFFVLALLSLLMLAGSVYAFNRRDVP